MDAIHPFPARMAPEIAFEFLKELREGSLIADPMCGSGVALRSAVIEGHRAVGFDADPLAVLMSKVWTENSQHSKLLEYASEVAERASRHRKFAPLWEGDPETATFVKFWFAPKQRNDLARLALTIAQLGEKHPAYITRALQIALSRLIVTKTKGASLAWDVAHSRPHKKKTSNDFNVLSEFVRACEILARKLKDNQTNWSCSVRRADARRLHLADESVDAIITSPPYMNAIDYMRGHRLSLVWLGYSLKDLRLVRSGSVGSERLGGQRVDRSGRQPKTPDSATQHRIDKYVGDIGRLVREFRRVARKGARVCIITANSRIAGYNVATNLIVEAAAAGAKLKLTAETTRKIEPSKRYLPTAKNHALRARMMEEHIQYFVAT
jgi:hypothetical protein